MMFIIVTSCDQVILLSSYKMFVGNTVLAFVPRLVSGVHIHETWTLVSRTCLVLISIIS